MSGNIARARALLLIVAALGTIGCDHITKHAASVYLAGSPDRSFLSDTILVGNIENTGGFLSLGADLPPIAKDAVLRIARRIALMALLGLVLRRKYTGSSKLGLVLFIAGGASNRIDRVLRGSVVNFLNMGIGPLRSRVFNMANVAIVLGAGFRTGRVGLDSEKWESSGSRSTQYGAFHSYRSRVTANFHRLARRLGVAWHELTGSSCNAGQCTCHPEDL